MNCLVMSNKSKRRGANKKKKKKKKKKSTSTLTRLLFLNCNYCKSSSKKKSSSSSVSASVSDNKAVANCSYKRNLIKTTSNAAANSNCKPNNSFRNNKRPCGQQQQQHPRFKDIIKASGSRIYGNVETRGNANSNNFNCQEIEYDEDEDDSDDDDDEDCYIEYDYHRFDGTENDIEYYQSRRSFVGQDGELYKVF